jgi:hypothetical protein
MGSDRVKHNEWLVGLINAGPYIGSAFLGCWLSGSFNTYLGSSRDDLRLCDILLDGSHRWCLVADMAATSDH